MNHRLNVIEELQLSFEIPYVSDRGEALDCLNVTLNERRHGVDISYALLEPSDENLDSVFPSDGVDVLAVTTKKILRELGVEPERLILQLWEDGLKRRALSVEGRAPVNRTRDTVLFMLTKTPFVYKFGYDLVLWHQGCHAKDRWEYRFPSAHPLVQVGAWLDALWHFSIDGRLEKWGKPHYTRDERLTEAIKIFRDWSHDCLPVDQVIQLCDDLWGREVTMTSLLQLGENLRR